MATSRISDDLQVAAGIIDQVDAFTLERFRASDLDVSTKADSTEVTDADRGAEKIIREKLAQYRSRDSIMGEEGEDHEGLSGRRWIIDPIDGTSNFVRGVPVWATLLALEEDGEIVVGIVSAPALNRRWWAGKGLGAYTGKSWASAKKIHVSDVADIKDASLSYSSLDSWAEHRRMRAFFGLAQQSWRTRAYGDFWSYMLVAEGAVDIAAEPRLDLHDMAALVPIVTEAGGKFTSLDGENGPYGSSAVATNGHLHDEVLEILSSVED